MLSSAISRPRLLFLVDPICNLSYYYLPVHP